jgi:hypothetical protein
MFGDASGVRRADCEPRLLAWFAAYFETAWSDAQSRVVRVEAVLPA